MHDVQPVLSQVSNQSDVVLADGNDVLVGGMRDDAADPRAAAVDVEARRLDAKRDSAEIEGAEVEQHDRDSPDLAVAILMHGDGGAKNDPFHRDDSRVNWRLGRGTTSTPRSENPKLGRRLHAVLGVAG